MENRLTTTRLILQFAHKVDSRLLAAFELRNSNFLLAGNQSRLITRLIFGMCSFTQIARGPFQACYLGYKIDHDYEGQGLMTEALQVAIDFIFIEYNLHRIMANYMPANEKSAKLLQRLSFVIEGRAEQYLLINGRWEDHIITSLINKNWKNV